jgi:hypothetical protein
MRVERINIEAGAQAIVGTVTPSGALTGKGSRQYGTSEQGQQRALEPPQLAAVRGEEAGWLAVPEAEGQGSLEVPAARRRTRQRRPEG